MKIGIFDSGVGGLIITHSLINALPEHDYLYLGDTERVPYGQRPQAEIYQFTREAIDYLFGAGCDLIIVACFTASAKALHKIQTEYLPKRYPKKPVLGVLIPVAEAAVSGKHDAIGILATVSTANSGAFEREFEKLGNGSRLHIVPAPLLVPLVESNDRHLAPDVIQTYLNAMGPVDALILGCTHYPFLKNIIRENLPETTSLISPDEIIPQKLADYLARHSDLDAKSEHTAKREFHVTQVNGSTAQLARELFGEPIELREVQITRVL